jgi:hypothetical protein
MSDGPLDKFDYDPDTNTYTYNPDKKIQEYPETTISTGGLGDDYNGSEYDPHDPWDDDPNNPDQYEGAKRIEVGDSDDISDAWANAIERDTANESDPDSMENQHRFKMFKVACQEFPGMIAEMLCEQNITMQEMVELDPWAAAALLMDTDIDEEDLAACIDDEIELNGYPQGSPDDDPAF